VQATLLTLAIAAILAMLAALVGPHFIDWNAHRGTFEQQASQAIGLPVRVTGPMDVRLLPSPSLVLSGVEIGKPGDAQALKAKALGIEFALSPLLSGKFRAVELRLIAPEMRVSLTQDGRALLPNALAGVDTQALSIDKLVVEDASLQLADAASGVSTTLTKLWFNGEVRALPGPIRGEGAFVMDGGLYGYRVATGRPEAAGSRIKLTIDPSDRPVYAEAEGFLTAEGGTPRFEGTATVARRAPLKGDKGDVAEPWRISARVKANAATALFEQVEYQYGPDDRALKLTGTAEAKFGARPRIDAVMSARTLDADKLFGGAGGANRSPREALAALVSAAERIIGPPIPTQVGFGIDQLTLGGTSLQNIRGDIEFGRGTMTVTAFEARAPGFTHVQASGRLDKTGDHLSFAGPVDVSSTDPRAFADWLAGKPGSALPARPVKFRGEVALGEDRIAIARMQAEFDRKAFEGDLDYRFATGTQPARLAATLRADDLDLDAWIGTAASVKPFADFDRPDDVSLALSFKRLRVAGLDATGADMRLSLKAGALAIETLKIVDLDGVTIDGKGRLDTKGQSGSVSFDLGFRDPQGLTALAKRAPALLAEPLARAAQRAAPGKLAGTVTIEPAARPGDTRLNISLAGPLGAMALKLTSAVSGQWSAPGAADLAIEGSLEAADVNALVKLADAERLIAVPRQPGTYTLMLKGKLDGDLSFDTRLVSANLDARAHGTMRPFTEDARRAALDISIAKADVILEGSDARTVPVAFKSRIVSNALGLRLDDMTANVAGSAMRGRLSVAYGEIPTIDGELRADTIDIAALLAAATGSGRAAKGERRWSDTPFALPSLPKLAGRMSVSAAQAVLAPSLQVSKFRSTLRFADADVTVEGIEGELLGGRLSGALTMRRGADGLGLQGRIAVTDADATQLLFGEGAAPLTGQAALQLQFEGAGRTPRALVGSLHGSGTLTLQHARIAALDPKAFAAAMQSVDQGLPIDAQRIRDVAGRALDAGPLAMPQAEATISIAAGVARIDTFKARTEGADLAAVGAYDLSDARIDLRLAMAGPAAGMSLQPEIVVTLKGPASATERVLDVSSLTGWLALRSVDRQTKKIEAIEQGRPAETPISTPRQDAPPVASTPKLEPAPAVRPRLVTPVPQREAVPRPDAPAAVPLRRPALPPALRPQPADGPRRVLVPQQQRAEPQRTEPVRPGPANPFPQPIGAPPPQQPLQRPSPPQQPVLRPLPPQTVRPIF
jgi:large subunit ribosomal protein L24